MYKFFWVSFILFFGILMKVLGINFSITELLIVGTAITIMVMLDDLINMLKGKKGGNL